MKKILPLFLCAFLIILNSNAQEQRKLSGKVTDGKNPIEKVSIQVEGKNMSTTTDKDGKYQLMVNTGNLVKYTYAGLRTIEIKIEDVTRILNPIMIPDVTELDEVTVEATKMISQKDLQEDYLINKGIFKTAFGYVDTKLLATNVRTIPEELINPINTCILDLLQNKAGVKVIGSCIDATSSIDQSGIQTSRSGAAVFLRGRESTIQGTNPVAAIFDIDGLIFTDVPFFLDTNTIKRIAIIPGLIYSARYGTFGAGGVIVINTITAIQGTKPVEDRARLKNNYLKGKVLTAAEVAQNSATYLKELNATGTLKEAKNVFKTYESSYSGSPYFYLDAHNYFFDRWSDQEYADSIMEENFALFEDNAVLLKALAYSYQEQGRLEKAQTILKEVFILRPNYAQSYIDMANGYRDIGKPRQAAALYARYEYLIEQGFLEPDTVGFEKIIGREFNNLLTLKKRAVVEAKNLNRVYVEEESFKGTRLVFEWNDGEAEFDLQFVNPENQYFIWKHGLFDNAEEITREKDFGYNIKEYLVDGSLPGIWKINAYYHGNKSLTPTYLKATVYANYGSPQQTKEVKVFKLFLKDVNQELFRIQSIANAVTN